MALVGILSVATLQGCLLTSPFHGQEFAAKTSRIPVQAWTITPRGSLKLYCAPSTRFGPHPNVRGRWTFVKDMRAQANGSIDMNAGKIYGANNNSVLPDECWNSIDTSGGRRHYTSLRVTQADYLNSPMVEYSVFTATGLECLGRAIGSERSWLGWSDKGCVRVYRNGHKVPYVVIVAR
jgi:hypothetical protein